MHADKKFPRPIEVSPNRIAWYEDELDAYIEKRPRRQYD
jgi:predicted DNA-binding transcriptional regulator AlpA